MYILIPLYLERERERDLLSYNKILSAVIARIGCRAVEHAKREDWIYLAHVLDTEGIGYTVNIRLVVHVHTQ